MKIWRVATTLVLVATAATLAAPAWAAPAKTTLSVDGLRTEYRENPLGIDVARPRLSFKLRSDARGVRQSAYEIRVASSEAALRAGRDLVWTSGRVSSGASVNRVYEGPKLQSGQRCYWQVRVWDAAGLAAPWSAPAYWEMGLLEPSDWKASWIEPDLQEDVAKTGPVPMLRREFELQGKVARARAYVTSHGLYELHLNGQRVGDELFTPGWTSYNKRLQYQVYDVTSLLQKGTNAAGALLGNGWYRGDLMGFAGRRNVYGDRLALLLQIEVTYSDGRREIVGSDGSWKAATGPILMSEIYHGETYDARLEKPGWTRSGFDDRDWKSVKLADYGKDTLVAASAPPVKRIEELRPVKVFKTPGGDTVVDMGQNMVGWPKLTVEGPAGTTVTLRHAEVLDKAGNFYTENLRVAQQTVRYTLRGGGPETFEPHFTFFGGRYVAVDGYPGELTADRLKGVVIHTDLPPGGAFETSSPLLNQLQHNIRWGQKGNFLDVPTDCPQRNERMGWTGDAQAFARTAAFNFDVASFFTKWLRDVAADQYENGSVPHVIPDALTRKDNPAAGAAGWADAAVIIPWTLYLTHADQRILEEQYPSMTRWLEYVRQRAGDDLVWDGDFQFADWLAYTAPSREARSYPGATTSKDLVATAFFAHSTDLLARIARVLGRGDDASRYAELFAKIKAAFRAEYVSERGRVGDASQTAYVLALEFDLLARRAAKGGGEAPRRGDPHAQAPHHGLPRHAVPVPRAEPLRLPRRGVPAAEPRGVPVVALSGEAGGDHDLGTLGRSEARRQLPGRVDELLQPLRLRRDRGVDVSRDGRSRPGRGGSRIRAHPDPAEARGRHHECFGQPRDALREGRIGVDARRRALRAPGRGASQHEGDGAAAQGAARQRDGRWKPARRWQRPRRPTAGRRGRRRRSGLGPVPVLLPGGAMNAWVGRLVALVLVLLLGALTGPGLRITRAAEDPLEAGFQDPPNAARPRVWWHWMNGNITKEGIKLDLEWMQRVGIGGFQNFDASLFPDKVVGPASRLHDAGVEGGLPYATTLADQLGLEMAIAGSPGWSESGGPWVTPAQAMKKLVWSETRARGGKRFTGALPKPPTTNGPFQNAPRIDLTSVLSRQPPPPRPEFYRDSAVIAFKLPAGDLPMSELRPVLTSSGGTIDPALLADGDFVKSTALPKAPVGEKAWIQFDFGKPVTIRGVSLAIAGFKWPFGPPPPGPDLEASDDGQTFRKIANIPASTSVQNTVSFTPAQARFFRVAFVTPPPPPRGDIDLPLPPPPTEHPIAELVLHTGARVTRFEEKAAFVPLAGALGDGDALGRAG